MTEHYRMFASSIFNIVIKLAYEGDVEADEQLNEKVIYEELNKAKDTSSFLVPYIGFYRSTSSPRSTLVTAAGEAIDDWNAHGCVVLRTRSDLLSILLDSSAVTPSSSLPLACTTAATSTVILPAATSSKCRPVFISSTWAVRRRLARR
jgi:hypothetical protein